MPIILDGTTGITTPGITNTGTFVFQGPVQVPAGSAATASITTAAGANTGIFFPSSSSVAITTAGTEKVSVGTGLIINDGGADFDTRIEGDTDANLFFADASTDRIGVGTSSPTAKLHVWQTGAATSLNIDGIENPIFAARYAANADGATVFLAKSRNATVGSHTIVQSGDELGVIKARGSNGTSFEDAAAIYFNVDGTPGSSGDMPGRIVFGTAADGTASITERARITSNGQIITAYDGGKYTQRGIVLLGSAFDNPVQSIITLPASGSTNSVISIKVTCNQNAYATAAANQHIGNARAMWDGSAWVKEVDTMTVVCGDIATVGTLAWSGSTLQYTTNRVSNYDGYLVTYEVLYNPTGTTLTYAF